MIEVLVGSLVWVAANGAYRNYVREGERGFLRETHRLFGRVSSFAQAGLISVHAFEAPQELKKVEAPGRRSECLQKLYSSGARPVLAGHLITSPR